jgi:hypothetical protein
MNFGDNVTFYSPMYAEVWQLANILLKECYKISKEIDILKINFEFKQASGTNL